MDKNFDIDDEMAVAKKPLSPSALKPIKLAVAKAGGQAAVADAARISQSQVSRFLNGQDVKLSTALSILKAIGGGITPTCSDPPPQACQDHGPGLDEQVRVLKHELADKDRAMAALELKYSRLQSSILEALKATCRTIGLSQDQVRLLKEAVTDPEESMASCEGSTSHQAAVGD